MLKRPDRKGFHIDKFKEIEFIISRCRFLTTNLEEEYKTYEASLENKEKIAKLIKN